MSEALNAARDYSEALSELQVNDKKQINLLTILAEDYADFASEIVRVIREAIEGEGDAKRKLAMLYVVDSIIKNIPIRGNYRDIFAHAIVSIFVTVFKEGNEGIRTSLYKVRNTWKGIFPQSRLRKLDLEVKSIDRNWPLVEEAPPTAPIVAPQSTRPPTVTTAPSVSNNGNQVIHVNPKFLNNGAAAPPTNAPPVVPILKPALKKPTVADPRVTKGTVIVPANGKRVVSMEDNTIKPHGSASAPDVKPEIIRPTTEKSKSSAQSDTAPVAMDVSEAPTQHTESQPNVEPRKVIKTEAHDDEEEQIHHKKHKKDKKKKTEKEKRDKEHEKSVSREKRKKSKTELVNDDSSTVTTEGKEDQDLAGSLISISPPPIEKPTGRRSREPSSSNPEVEEKRARRDSPVQDIHFGQSKHHQFQHRRREQGRFDKHARGPVPSLTPSTRPPLLPTPAQQPTATLGSHAFAAPPQVSMPMPIVSSAMPPMTSMGARMAIPPPGIIVPIPPVSGLAPGLIMQPMMPIPPPMPPGMSIPMMPPQIPQMPLVPTVISNETTRLPNVPANNRIFVDGKAYEVLHVKDERGREIAVIERNGLPHKIEFTGTTRDLLIDGVAHTMAFGEARTVYIDGEPHVLRFGAPSREFYIGDFPFKGSFGGAPIIANINGRRHEIRLCGPPPEVKIEQDPSYDLIRFMNEMRRQQQLQQQQSDFKVKEEKKDSDLDVKELLSKLQKSGILKQLAKTEEPSTSKTLAASSPARGASPPVPSNHRLDIIERRPNPSTAMKEFNMRTFFYRYDSVIQELHRERISCPTCNIEFKERGEAYQLHLDEHLKEMVLTNNKGYSRRSRPWYMEEENWVNHSELEEVNNLPNLRKGVQHGAVNTMENTTSDIPAEDTEMKECQVCNEAFEQYWDDEDDIWKLRDCVIQNKKAYHRACLTDATMLDQPMEEDEEADETPELVTTDNQPIMHMKIDSDFLNNVINQANRV